MRSLQTTLYIFTIKFLIFNQFLANDLIISHAISMNGIPKYDKNFKNFDYVNALAPKGGKVRLNHIGTFDSFNPFISKGVPAIGTNMIFQTLTVGSADEPFTQYGLIAEKIEYPSDRNWVVYHLNPKARFNDGKPIEPDDVIFSYNTLLKKGSPFYKVYYKVH